MNECLSPLVVGVNDKGAPTTNLQIGPLTKSGSGLGNVETLGSRSGRLNPVWDLSETKMDFVSALTITSRYTVDLSGVH